LFIKSYRRNTRAGCARQKSGKLKKSSLSEAKSEQHGELGRADSLEKDLKSKTTKGAWAAKRTEQKLFRRGGVRRVEAGRKF